MQEILEEYSALVGGDLVILVLVLYNTNSQVHGARGGQ